MERPHYLLRLIALEPPPAGTTADLTITLLDHSGEPIQGAGVELEDGALFLNRYQLAE
jgi:hypothetical protein